MTVLPTLNHQQTRDMARLLVESYGVDPLQTMENAGRNLALVTKMLLGNEIMDCPVVVLAGRGSSGGSGLAAARHLLNWGAWVQVLCSSPVEGYTGAPARQLHTLQMMGVPLAWAEEGWELPPCDLVIDTILDAEARGIAEGRERDLIELANSTVAPILSLDVPSGVDGEDGKLAVPHIHAAATLAVALPKQGLLTEAARKVCGDLYLGDIGVPLALYEELGIEISPFFHRDPIVRWDVVDGIAQIIED